MAPSKGCLYCERHVSTGLRTACTMRAAGSIMRIHPSCRKGLAGFRMGLAGVYQGGLAGFSREMPSAKPSMVCTY
eukprot:3771191-Pyramimonas_sp.AAC.1